MPPQHKTRRRRLGMLAAALLAPLLISSAEAALIAHYPLDGDGSDLSSQANDAQLAGPRATADRDGVAGAALAFDGQTSLLSAPRIAASDGLAGITVSAWIHPSAVKTQVILSKGGSQLAAPFVLATSATGELIFGVTPEGRSVHTQARAPFTTDGDWHLVAGRYDGTNVTLWLDGAEVAREALSGPLPSNSSPLLIGGRSGTAADTFLGDLDEVRIYDSALGDDELAALASPNAPSPDGGTPTRPGTANAGLNLATGTATLVSGSRLQLNGLSYNGTALDAMLRLNADGTWAPSADDRPEPLDGLNLGSAAVSVIGENLIRFNHLEFADDRFDAVISLNTDGTWNLESFGYAPDRDDRRIGSGALDLYPGRALNGVSAEVLQTIALGPYLYASVRYGDGAQRIDAWDLNDPLAPRLIEQYDYGNYRTGQQDYDLQPELAVSEGYLLVQSSLDLTLFRPGADGRLQQVAPETGHQIALPSRQSIQVSGGVAAVADGTGARQLFSLTNPAHAFAIRDSGQPLSSEGDLSGSFLDEPATLSVSGTQARLTVYHRDLSGHFDGFWDEKLSLLFPGAALDRPLGALIDDAVNGIGIDHQLNQLYATLPDQLTVSAEATLDQRIQASYADDYQLRELLATLEIDTDDNFEAGLRRVVRAQLSAEAGDLAARLLLEPLWQRWFGETLGLETDLPDLDALAERFTTVMNGQFDSSEAAAYLARKIVGPLLDNPPYITETLGATIHSIDGNFATDVVDGLLVGARNVLDPGGAVERVLDEVGVDAVVPMCFIPENSRGLLEMALYDHLGLNPDGLALLEVLKFYQYYAGNSSYLDYETRIDEVLRALHDELAQTLAAGLSPALDALRFSGSIQQRFRAFSAQLPAKELLVEGLSETLLARLRANGIDTDRGIRAVLADLGLYVENADLPNGRWTLSTVAELRSVLNGALEVELADDYGVRQSIPLGGLQLRALFEMARHEVAAPRRLLVQLLARALERDFGAVNLQLTLRGALAGYITRHVDLAGTLAATVSGLLGGLAEHQFNLSTGLEELPIIDAVALARAFQEGDCIAGWQLYMEAVEIAGHAAALATLGSTEAYAWEVHIAREGLKTAKKMVVNYFIDRLVLELASMVFDGFSGSFDNLMATTRSLRFDLDVGAMTTLSPARVEGVLLNDRIGFVLVENRGNNGLRHAALVTVNPYAPDDYREIDLGYWDLVDYIHTAGGVVMLGGTDADYHPAALFVDGRADQPEVTAIASAELSATQSMELSDDGAQLLLRGTWGVKIVPLTAR